MPLNLPIFFVSLYDALTSGARTGMDPTKMPVLSLVFVQVWESLINMVLWPIMYLGYAYLYCDLKMRQQAVDVVQSLDQLQHAGG